MKRIYIYILVIIVLLFFIKTDRNIEEEFRGVYISYIEISKYLKDKDEETAKNNINDMINKLKELNINNVILQVRPSSDAMYYSKIFPISKYLSDNRTYSFDVLEYFIKKSHENDMKLISWINPYRVSTTSNKEEITKENPAYKYLDTDTIYINNGIYYNPSKEEVNDIIINGVKEVLEYDVDGILFDDYFYPSKDVDIKDYEKYRKDNDITIDDYHLMIINNMVEEVHNVCKEKNVEFGISPEGNIENNYNNNYADVKKWLESDRYIDFIMPQIYYGFNNSNKPYINTINEWNNLIKNENIKFYPALAFYKVGNQDNYALAGKDEWMNNDNIIMKEILIARNLTQYDGFSMYRYDSLFAENAKEELINVKKIIN